VKYFRKDIIKVQVVGSLINMYFSYNRTTLQVFVTYLTGALYVHLL